jgi:hypothetical protein
MTAAGGVAVTGVGTAVSLAPTKQAAITAVKPMADNRLGIILLVSKTFQAAQPARIKDDAGE